MGQIQIAKAEHGVIRVFSISRPMADMARALKQQPKAQVASALLAYDASASDIELFPVSDLAGVGLPRYLMDGYDIDSAALRTYRARLEGLDGYVLILFSSISNDGDVVLSPSADLTLIGTFSEPKGERTVGPIATESARAYSGVTDTPAPIGRSRAGSALTAAAVILILILIWWIL